jgi:hypothetical protein
MHARNLELNEERGFVAIIRCDTRSYRRADSKDPFDRIEEGDPVYEVWRAGCDGPRAASLATRNAKLNGIATPAPTPATPAPATGEKGTAAAGSIAREAKSAPAARHQLQQQTRPGRRRSPRRQLHTVRGKGVPRRDATITNTCKFAVEVAYCYKAGQWRIRLPVAAAPNAWTAWDPARRTICRSTSVAATAASRWSRARA